MAAEREERQAMVVKKNGIMAQVIVGDAGVRPIAVKLRREENLRIALAWRFFCAMVPIALYMLSASPGEHDDQRRAHPSPH